MNFNPTGLRLTIAAGIFAAALAVDLLRPQVTFRESNLRYDWQHGAPFELKTPAQSASRFTLRFALYSEGGGDVLLVGGRAGDVLKLRISRARLSAMFFGIDSVPLTITDSLQPGRWHAVTLAGRANDAIDITVDNRSARFPVARLMQIQSSAAIGSRDFRFDLSRIEVGSAFGAPLRGRVGHFLVAATYREPLPPALLGLGVALFAAAFLWALWPWAVRFFRADAAASDITSYVVVCVILGAAFALTQALSLQLKWLLLLALALPLLGPFIRDITLPGPLLQGLRARFGMLALLLCAASMLTLPGTIAIARMFEELPFATAIVLLAFAYAAAFMLDSARRIPNSRPGSASYLQDGASCLIFAAFALRSDSLFSPIHALHWEYFLGPMRAIRDGGWLFWDTPSQYGFLNIVLPAALPFGSAINAFFYFQAFLLFAAALIYYFVLRKLTGLPWVFAVALIVAAFFLADPILVGPAAYPSESVARFFWCYALFACGALNFLGSSPSLARYARAGGVIWAASLLWSAEAAFYATLLYGFPLAAGLLRLRTQAALKEILRCMLLPAALAVGEIVAVELYYAVSLHHWPDWSMYFMYALSYGAGFGGLNVPWFGPLWLAAVVLAAALSVMFEARGRWAQTSMAAQSAALTLIAASYYIGRAYPIVMTITAPMLILALIALVRARPHLPNLASVTFIPVVAIALFSSFWNPRFPQVLGALPHLRADVSAYWPAAPPALQELLFRGRVRPSERVVYYDTWIAMPRLAAGVFEKSWLPQPIEDLETPIPPKTREEVVERFIARQRASGYLVQAIGGYNSPASMHAWLGQLAPYYDWQNVYANGDYALLRVSLKQAHAH